MALRKQRWGTANKGLPEEVMFALSYEHTVGFRSMEQRGEGRTRAKVRVGTGGTWPGSLVSNAPLRNC